MEKEAGYSTNSQSSSQQEDQGGSLSKMFPDSSTVQKGKISESSSRHWMNSGIAYHGEFSMLNTLEHHSEDEECTLSEVIEATSQPRYFLSQDQLRSLLERASARGTSLPKDFQQALETQITTLSNMRQLAESQKLDPRLKDTEMMEKVLPSIPEEARMLFVRRMSPSEYERLQGFPSNWTEVDTEQ